MTDDNQVIGLLGIWQFKKFNFIEHFAVREDLRGQGLGSQMIQDYAKSDAKPIVLETERPKTKIAKRRIGFWQRNGFILNEYDYIQPPYSPEKYPVPMFLMSKPHPLTPEEFESYRTSIHTAVYERKSPLVKIKI